MTLEHYLLAVAVCVTMLTFTVDPEAGAGVAQSAVMHAEDATALAGRSAAPVMEMLPR